jgi:hypothetical protein
VRGYRYVVSSDSDSDSDEAASEREVDPAEYRNWIHWRREAPRTIEDSMFLLKLAAELVELRLPSNSSEISPPHFARIQGHTGINWARTPLPTTLTPIRRPWPFMPEHPVNQEQERVSFFQACSESELMRGLEDVCRLCK